MISFRWKRVIVEHKTHPNNIVEVLLALRNMNAAGIHADIVHDPFLLPDIQNAIARILSAKKSGERVMIFGDYDVDGISSTAALFLFLRDEFGMDVSYRLPHRVRDGYGMKEYHIEEIAATGSKLLITVDCWTKDIEPIKRAWELWLDVIITDHHSCPEILPECVAVVNPRRKDSLYPFLGLSGSGVVWKLIHALSLTYFWEEKTYAILQKYVDIISLGTVADCMPMLDENRTIVRRWLMQARDSHHPFFQIFSGILNRPIVTEEDIGFFVWPMLNAGGRITTPYQSISALLASSLDAYTRVQDLMVVNETRKSLSRDAYERAIEDVDSSAPFIIYIDENLEHGLLGLVAGKLSEMFHRPTAVFTIDGDHYVGSLRAPEGIDLVKILDASSEYILRYGWHAGAAGCTIMRDMMPQACEKILLATEQSYTMQDFIPTLMVDTVLDMTKIDVSFMQQIESLRPFGMGFRSPLFMLHDITSALTPLGSTGQHFKWEIETKGLDIIGFNLDDIISELSDTPVHLIGRLSTRTWRDTITLQFQVIDAVKA